MSIPINNGKRELIAILGCLLAGTSFGYAAKQYMSIPYVEISATTGKCVGVFDADGPKWVDGCDRIPKKYKTILVQ